MWRVVGFARTRQMGASKQRDGRMSEVGGWGWVRGWWGAARRRTHLVMYCECSLIVDVRDLSSSRTSLTSS